MPKFHVLVATFSLLLTTSAAAQQERNAIIGTWKINMNASKFANIAFTPKEHVEVYRELPDGRIELRLTRTMSSGAPNNFTGTWPAQGGVVEEASTPAFLIVETLIDSRTWFVTQMRDGRQIATIHKVVDPNGRTMRQVVKGVDEQGKAFEQIQVLDRQ